MTDRTDDNFSLDQLLHPPTPSSILRSRRRSGPDAQRETGHPGLVGVGRLRHRGRARTASGPRGSRCTLTTSWMHCAPSTGRPTATGTVGCCGGAASSSATAGAAAPTAAHRSNKGKASRHGAVDASLHQLGGTAMWLSSTSRADPSHRRRGFRGQCLARGRRRGARERPSVAAAAMVRASSRKPISSVNSSPSAGTFRMML